jgi:fatty-acyl-CoA synthase
VVGVPDARFGERICAVVDFVGDRAPTLQDMAGHVKSILADYKAPRELVLAKVERAPNGKLDYRSVKEMALKALAAPAT